jgi:hypothetical protein
MRARILLVLLVLAPSSALAQVSNNCKLPNGPCAAAGFTAGAECYAYPDGTKQCTAASLPDGGFFAAYWYADGGSFGEFGDPTGGWSEVAGSTQQVGSLSVAGGKFFADTNGNARVGNACKLSGEADGGGLLVTLTDAGAGNVTANEMVATQASLAAHTCAIPSGQAPLCDFGSDSQDLIGDLLFTAGCVNDLPDGGCNYAKLENAEVDLFAAGTGFPGSQGNASLALTAGNALGHDTLVLDSPNNGAVPAGGDVFSAWSQEPDAGPLDELLRVTANAQLFVFGQPTIPMSGSLVAFDAFGDDGGPTTWRSDTNSNTFQDGFADLGNDAVVLSGEQDAGGLYIGFPDGGLAKASIADGTLPHNAVALEQIAGLFPDGGVRCPFSLVNVDGGILATFLCSGTDNFWSATSTYQDAGPLEIGTIGRTGVLASPTLFATPFPNLSIIGQPTIFITNNALGFSAHSEIGVTGAPDAGPLYLVNFEVAPNSGGPAFVIDPSNGTYASTDEILRIGNNGTEEDAFFGDGRLVAVGGVDRLTCSTGTVAAATAVCPSAGQVLTAINATRADWETPIQYVNVGGAFQGQVSNAIGTIGTTTAPTAGHIATITLFGTVNGTGAGSISIVATDVTATSDLCTLTVACGSLNGASNVTCGANSFPSGHVLNVHVTTSGCSMNTSLALPSGSALVSYP